MTTNLKDTDYFQQPLTVLTGIGEKIACHFEKLSIFTLQDLLFHLPLRYLDKTRIVPISELRQGNNSLVTGEILSCDIKYGKKMMLLCQISDGTAVLTLRFFHYNKQQQARLKKGQWLWCFGEVKWGRATAEIIHPEYQLVTVDNMPPVEKTLTPLYPTTEGISQYTLRRAMHQVLGALEASRDEGIQDYLPYEIQQDQQLPSLFQSLQYLHSPPSDCKPLSLLESGDPFRRRLVFEELLAHQLSMKLLHHQRLNFQAPPITNDSPLADSFIGQLPFHLTRAQQQVIAEIVHDLQQRWPMQRLIQGDVGSGKTVVAAIAALYAIESGYQVALMAPTELLAEQHRENFQSWFAALGLTMAWLSGKMTVSKRRQALEDIASGRAQIIIGTHALFQDTVDFKCLGLVIIDEQHRFGVHQRYALMQKGNKQKVDESLCPHQLIMTATPIPRTLAMTAFADMDCSVIDELPPGRIPVDTVVVSEQRRDDVLERVHQACLKGRQAYWVCTLIEESDTLQCQAAEEAYEKLRKQLPDVAIGLVHGRMSGKEKQAVMQAFKNAKLALLIATTVIEVGVDVPNASLMIIENAERLGLSQLHQLRGRVGRGSQSSVCVLMYSSPLSKQGKARLHTLRETSDGFEVARKDLLLRGPGEFLGTRQTGLAEMKIADIVKDQVLIPQVNRVAEQMMRAHQDCIEPLINRWIGKRIDYKNV